jgi:hypothetical protein
MLTFIVCFALSLVIVLLCGCFHLLSLIERNTRDSMVEIRDLRLTSRTRFRQASMQSGATSEEQKLERLGRVSQGHRVVVGGDSNSELNRRLNGLGVKDEDEDG